MPTLLHRAWRRFRRHGVRHTLTFLFGRGVPIATGVPLLRFGQVTPSLFVGSQHGRFGRRWLRRHGIEHVVNMRAEFDDSARGLTLTGYCHLPTIDMTPPTIEQLREGVRFIRAALSSGGKVYIHCLAGVGRAPSMAIAYLVSEGVPLSEASAQVRAARPFIDFTDEQLARLEEFAATLTIAASVPPAGGSDTPAPLGAR